MRIEVDPALCEANARCVTLAPEVFSLDDEEILQLADPGESVDPDRLRRAVDACPMTALTLIEAPRPVSNS